MTVQNADGERPRLRADARENKDRIVAAAARVFAEQGEEASLKTIAEEAGVGIGTLYRRFGTREALVAAVNLSRILAVCDLAEELVADGVRPDDALRSWLQSLAEFLVRRHVVAAALIPVPAGVADMRLTIRARLVGAIELLMTRAEADGQMRGDIAPTDLLQLVGGAAYAAADLDQARRFVDLVADGLAADG